MYKRVWVKIKGSSPTRWKRGWKKIKKHENPNGPATGFSWREVASGPDKNPAKTPVAVKIESVRVAESLNKLRALAKKQHKADRVVIVVNSWYRSPSWNKAVGGVSNSRHLIGDAVDIQVFVAKGKKSTKLSIPEVHRLAGLVPDFANGGRGRYPRQGFNHLDLGPRRTWDG